RELAQGLVEELELAAARGVVAVLVHRGVDDDELGARIDEHRLAADAEEREASLVVDQPGLIVVAVVRGGGADLEVRRVPGGGGLHPLGGNDLLAADVAARFSSIGEEKDEPAPVAQRGV